MHHQTSTLRLAVALTYFCCSLQIAQPLATTGYNDDYDAPQQQHAAAHTIAHTADVGVPENLLPQHHVRHRTSHHTRRSAHRSRHNQQPHVELAGGLSASESAAEFSALPPAAALVGSDEATESLNFLHASHLHKLQQHTSTKFGAKYGTVERLHLQHQKLSGDELELEPNSLRTHLHHKHHALKSRTTTTATATTTMSTTNNSAWPIVTEARTTAQTMELVKSTSHPTKSAECNTIQLDEVNKGTQNYYQQPIIHLQQQQHQQQAREQVHYKHHKLQPAADLSRSKHTMTSVHWDQPPLPTHKTHNKLVHAGSQINVVTDDDGDNVTAKAHEQPPAVVAVGGGGVGKENKTTKMSSESAKGLTTEVDPHRSSSSSAKASDYVTGVDADAGADDNAAAADDDDDDGFEYYDYVVDDESTAAEQHTLAAPDIGGFSYGSYDSGIEPDWYASKKEHHQQQKQQQQIRHYQEQRQRRQSQYQYQPQHIQQQQQQQQQTQRQQRTKSGYQTEHSRVARDHNHIQAVELQNNHLAYDTSSDDDEYPDDEPGRDSDEPPTGEVGDITKHKLSTLGTPEDVKQAHRSYLQMQVMPSRARDHIRRMKSATACHWPMPRVVPVSNYTSVTYNPQYTILYRCGEDTGCCRSKGQVCTVKEYENVTLYFLVETVNSSNSYYDTLKLRNDTRCECVNRSQLTSTTDSFTRDKRSNLAVCRCPREFDVFQDIRWQSLRQRQTYNCRCDCKDANTSCQRLKNGDEGFAMDDRRCIAESLCSVPNCSFGIYNEQTGRCPRSNRKVKRHNSGFG